MIITLKGADFTNANIGTLSDWVVTPILGDGATYSGATSVARGESLSASVVIDNIYEILASNISITMGGRTLGNAYIISGNVVAINIPEVTGKVVIKITPTIRQFTYTLNITPATAVITLMAEGYGTVTGVGKASIKVDANTNVSWSAKADGYRSAYGVATVGDNMTSNIELDELSVITGKCTMAISSIDQAYSAKGFIPGRTYAYSITADYTGNFSLYYGDSTAKANGMVATVQKAISADVPITGIITMPFEGVYHGTKEFYADLLLFRSNTTNTVNFEYTFTEIDVVNVPLKGTTSFANSTINSYFQRVFCFEEGATYNYTIIPSYTGNLTIYAAYSDYSNSTGSQSNLSVSHFAVEANKPYTGTFTLPTTESTTLIGRLPDVLILRSNTSDQVTIEYEFVKVEE